MAANSTKTPGSNGLSAIIFAVFAVACLVAFLWFRGSDVGQLPQLLGNLSGGPLFGIGIKDAMFGIFVALLIAVAWFEVGSWPARLIVGEGLDEHWTLRFVRNTTVGAAIWSLVWFVLGPTSGAYTTASAVTLIVLEIVLALSVFRRIWKSIFKGRVHEDRSSLDKVLIVLIAIAVILTLTASLAPPTAKDTLLYHFAVPKAFIAQHSSAFIDGNIASYLALGTEMHSVWAMLLGGYWSPRAAETAAGATMFLFFPLLLMGVYGWARELGISRNWALVATAIVATVPTAYHVASSGYIDLSLTLYVTLATYALTRWWKEPSWSWAILIAIFLGAALSIKLTAVFVFAAFALIILLRARNPVDSHHPVSETLPPLLRQEGSKSPGSDTSPASSSGRIVVSGFAALLLAGVIASPWYIRTWIATGSPVFPFYMSIWPGKANGWDVERSNLFQGMNSQYGGADVNKLNYLTAPARVSIMAQPEQPANYDGVLGVAFLIGLPLLIWALWKFDLPVEVKISVGVTAIIYLFWLFSNEQLRYLLPIVPVLAIAIAASAEKIGGVVSKVARCALIAASVCGLLTSLAWFCQKAPLRVVFGGETRDQYLTRNLDYYPYYQTLNTETPADAKVWLINMRRDTYNIDRPVFSDYLFEDWTLRKMVWESRSVQELRSKTAGMGIKYVLTRHDFLFDYDKSSLVDDKKPRAENEAKLKIAKDFILDPANTVRADNKFSLIKVF